MRGPCVFSVDRAISLSCLGTRRFHVWGPLNTLPCYFTPGTEAPRRICLRYASPGCYSSVGDIFGATYGDIRSAKQNIDDAINMESAVRGEAIEHVLSRNGPFTGFNNSKKFPDVVSMANDLRPIGLPKFGGAPSEE